ncbi:MAG: hypothetical protein AB7R00_21670 [Kofleriaceae bacterium]
MTRFSVAATVVLALAGCPANDDGTGNEAGGGGGKADSADDTCQTELLLWLHTFAPPSCTDGPSCVGQVPLATMPACGPLDHWFWFDAYRQHVLAPWLARYEQARLDYVYTPQGPYFEDHDRFVQQIALSDAELDAHARLLQIPTRGSRFEYYEWLGQYQHVLLEYVAPRVVPLAVSEASDDGRMLCDQTPVPDLPPPPPCWEPYEPAMMLNVSERELLAMLEQTAPTLEVDGGFAEWSSAYFAFLTRGFVTESLNFEFPQFAEATPLFPHELALYAELRNMRPPAIGTDDSYVWLSRFSILLLTADLANPNQLAQLDLFDESAPARLIGAPAYRAFAESYASHVDEPAKLERLVKRLPCARDAAELAELEHEYVNATATYQGVDFAPVAAKLCE